MRNSINNVSTLFGGIGTNIDIEENASDLVVIQRSNMVIAYTSRMASRYQAGEPYWVVKTMGYNATNEVVYVITGKPTRVMPDFIPDEVK